MIRQVGRVISDLERQIAQSKLKKGKAQAIVIVGINRAPQYVSYEGESRG